MEPYVSIIISTYNRAQYIGITIDSFLRQSYQAELYEIIICDNNSTDNTKEIIESYAKKESEEGTKVRYLFEKRQGLHYVKNYAAKKANGQILLFTDDDMIADYNLLTELVKAFKDNVDVGVATGRVLPKWKVTPPSWIEKYCNNHLLSLNDLGDKTKIADYDLGVFGCFEAVKRDIFFKTGGFHPDLFGSKPGLGDGETGLNQDIIKLGMGIQFAYVGTSVIYHMIPPSRMTQTYLNNRLIYGGNAKSYSEYRNAPFGKREIVRRVWKYLKSLIKWEIVYFIKGLKGDTTLRFSIAIPYYYVARIKYDIRIVCDKDFRDFVENNYWW